jgi:hypothetical protein
LIFLKSNNLKLSLLAWCEIIRNRSLTVPNALSKSLLKPAKHEIVTKEIELDQ